MKLSNRCIVQSLTAKYTPLLDDRCQYNRPSNDTDIYQKSQKFIFVLVLGRYSLFFHEKPFQSLHLEFFLYLRKCTTLKRKSFPQAGVIVGSTINSKRASLSISLVASRNSVTVDSKKRANSETETSKRPAKCV